jgi:hypothetical protein
MKTTLTCAKRLIVLFFTTIVFGLFIQAQTTITLGTGTSVNGSTSYPTPYGHYYKNQRVQYLILASELTDLGYNSGTIQAIAFEVSILYGMDPLPNYVIKGKLTTAISLTTTFDNSGLTELYSNASLDPVVGWNQHNFSTNLVWDGTSNILLDLCYDLVTSNAYTKNAGVYYTQTSFTSVNYYFSDSQVACGRTSANYTSSNRANIRLIGDFASCQPPTNLLVNNTETTTADMQWTAGGDETLWNLKYGAPDFDLETGGTLISGLSAANYSFTGLSAGSTYKVVVQADCGGGELSDWAEIHFNTLCETVSTNIDQDFNTDFDELPPLCWTSETETGNSSFQFLQTAANPTATAYGGSGRMLVWASDTIASGNQSRFIAPEMNTQGLSSLTYQYAWYESSGEPSATNEGVQIQYSLDGSTWEGIGSLVSRYGSTEGWVFKSFDFPAAALDIESVYIGFLFTSQGGLNCYLDELAETDCLSPSQLTVSFSATPNQVEFEWEEPSGFSGVGYEWELRTTGTPFSGEPGVFDSGTPTAGTSTTTVTGVAESTNYTFYIRSDCGSSSYSQNAFASFTTPSDWPKSLPFVEDFASSSTPLEWINTGPEFWLFSTNAGFDAALAGDHTPGGGTNYAWIDGSFGVDANALITPNINISEAAVPIFEFYYFSNNSDNPGDNNTIDVYALDKDGVPINIFSYSGDNPEWQHFSYPFPPSQFQGTTQIIFAITGTASTTYYNDILIDDIKVYDFASLCFPPQNLALESVTSNQATLNWNDVLYNGPVEAFEWELRTEGTPFSPDPGLEASDSESGDVFTRTISGLDPATYYTFYMRSKCGDFNYSEVVEISFGTACTDILTNIDQDFNTNLGEALPLCWTTQFEINNSAFKVLESAENPTTSAYGGSGKMLVWASDTITAGNQSRLVSPPLNTTDLTDLYYSFNWYQSSGEPTANTEGLQVQYSTDLSTWIPIGNQIPRYGDLDMWTIESFVLPAAALDQPEVFIGFLFSSEGGQNCYFDEFVAATCLPPGSLEVGYNNEYYKAIFNWTEPEVLPSVGYEWELRTSGNPFSLDDGLIDSGSISTGSSSDEALNLLDLTEYTFYIRSDCGSSSYSDTASITFTSPAWPKALPFIEDFAAITTPESWTNQGDEPWLFNTEAGYNGDYPDHTEGGGTNYAWVNRSGGIQLNELSTPLINIKDIGIPKVEFYHYGYNSLNYKNILIVDIWNGLVWQEIFNYEGNVDAWQHFEYYIDTTNFADEIKLRFEIEPGSVSPFYMDIAIDDVSVTDMTDYCFAPRNIRLDSINPYYAEVGWDDVLYNSPVEEFEWELRTEGNPFSGDPGLILDESVAGNVFKDTLEGLDPATEYYFYTRSKCGTDNYGEPQEFIIITPCAVVNPPIFESFEGNQFIPLCWSQEYVSSSADLSRTNSNAFDGDYRVQLDRNSSTTRATRLVSPPINTHDLDQLTTDFYLLLSYNSSTSGDSLRVQYRIGAQGDWINAGFKHKPYINDLADGYIRKRTALPSGVINKDTVYVGYVFYVKKGTAFEDLYVDAITIDSSTFCPAPENLSLDSTKFDNSYFSWTFPGTEPNTEFEYQVRSAGTPDDGDLPDLVKLSSFGTDVYTGLINGLEEDTDYNLFVRAKCFDGDSSVWSSPLKFTSGCAVSSLPDQERFLTNAIPECWDQEYLTGSTWFNFSSSAAKPPLNSDYDNSPYMVTFDNDYAYRSRLISKPYNTNGLEKLAVEFYWYHYNKPLRYPKEDKMFVQFSLDKENWHTLGDSVRRESTFDYWDAKSFVVPDSLLNRNVIYFGFLFEGTDNNSSYISALDNIRFTDCYFPPKFKIDSLGMTAASFSWLQIEGNQGFEFELREYGEPGSGADGLKYSNLALSPGDTSITVPGLSGDTQYFAYVRNVCGPGVTSIWSTRLNVHTLCGLEELNYYQDFNIDAADELPLCWKIQDTYGSIPIYFPAVGENPTIPFAYGGTGRMLMANTNPGSHIDGSYYRTRVESAPLDASNKSDIQVSFQWYESTSYDGYPEGVQLQYSLDGFYWIDVGDFIDRESDDNTGWVQKIIDLPEQAFNQPILYVGLEFDAGYYSQGDNCYLDEFRVIGFSENCLLPDSTVLVQKTNETALVAWPPASVEPSEGYIYELRTEGLPGSSVIGLVKRDTTANPTDTSVLFTNLSPSQDYQFYLQSYCGDNELSIWSDVLNFTTYCGFIMPDTLVDFTTAGPMVNPGCWTQDALNGDYAITYPSSGLLPSVSSGYGGSGQMLYWNSNQIPNGGQTRLVTDPISTVDFDSLEIVFQWYHSETGGPDLYQGEGVQLQYSLDTISWFDFDDFVKRYNPISG